MKIKSGLSVKKGDVARIEQHLETGTLKCDDQVFARRCFCDAYFPRVEGEIFVGSLFSRSLRSPLALAIAFEQVECVRLLIRFGANWKRLLSPNSLLWRLLLFIIMRVLFHYC
jgi:hypothetical protein